MNIAERLYRGVYLQAKTLGLLLWEASAPAHNSCWECRKEVRPGNLSVARDCSSSKKLCSDCTWEHISSLALTNGGKQC